MALVICRFLRPVAGFVPRVASMAGLNGREFLIWSVPYALTHVAIRFFLGDALDHIGSSLTRIAVLTGILVPALLILWTTLYAALRL